MAILYSRQVSRTFYEIMEHVTERVVLVNEDDYFFNLSPYTCPLSSGCTNTASCGELFELLPRFKIISMINK